VLDDPLGELLARVVGDVLSEKSAQEVATTGDREADREGELSAEGMAVHWAGMFLFCSGQRSPVGEGIVKGCRKPVVSQFEFMGSLGQAIRSSLRLKPPCSPNVS
jgi:hypothetical protein